MSDDDPVHVPHELLAREALIGVIDEFVTRDGTELSDVEPKRRDVLRLLERGEAAIYFDPATSTCSIRRVDPGQRP